MTRSPAVGVVLASASPARLRVLTAAGVDPLVHVSDVDEDAVMAALPPDTGPAETVRALAAAKARAVAAAHAGDLPADAVIIGCDSMLFFDGHLSGKPHEPAVAAAQWREMRGRTAELLTGHHVMRVGNTCPEPIEVGDTSSTTITFADVDDATIDAYVATGEPLEVAGAFTLDGHGGWLIERVDGDPSSVIGIGLPLVRKLIERTGVSLTDIWRPGTPGSVSPSND